MLISVSLDLWDLGIISDISHVLTQISSALPFSQSPSSLHPGHPNGHQLSLSFCFHCRRPSGHMPRSTSPVATTGPEWHNLHAWESKLSRQQILTSGREKAETDGRYVFSSFFPLMDCSGHNISIQPVQRGSLWLSGHLLRNQLWLFMAFYEAMTSAVTHHLVLAARSSLPVFLPNSHRTGVVPPNKA